VAAAAGRATRAVLVRATVHPQGLAEPLQHYLSCGCNRLEPKSKPNSVAGADGVKISRRLRGLPSRGNTTRARKDLVYKIFDSEDHPMEGAH
jgi:hypothetical protein